MVRYLKRHIRKFHTEFYETHLQARLFERKTTNDQTELDKPSCCEIMDHYSEQSQESPVIDIKKHVANKLLWLREECKLSYKACSEVASACSDIFSSYSSNLTTKLHSATTQEELQNVIVNEGAFLEETLGNFSDQRNLNHYVEQHFSFVGPEEYTVGNGSFKSGRFQYIPILATLKSLLMHDDVFSEVVNSHKSLDGNLRDICDGSYMNSHPLFGQSPNSLQIILYYDDFTTANPIGHQVKEYKFAAFYFTLGNISPQYRSKLHVTQLVALAKSKLIKDHGFSAILSPLLRDLKILEVNGLSVVKDGVNFVFHGSLAVVVADNLASHSIGGFMESFSSFRNCRFCMATKADVQISTEINSFERRTRASYDEQCETVATYPDLAKTYGLKKRSCLNDLTYFHVCDGLPSDVVHDLFEGGLGCVVLEYIIAQCIQLGYFTLEFLNCRITEFNYQSCDRTNRPGTLGRSSGSLRISQKAVQVWCLLRLLPMFVGKMVPSGAPVWEVLLKLIDVVELIVAKTLSNAQAIFLDDLIKDLLTTFQKQFPEQTFKPKTHFVMHYPAQLLKFGPLVHLWTMRFEGKHAFFKEAARRTKNYKNLPLSLSLRHQYYQAMLHESADYLSKQDKRISGGAVVPVCIFEQSIQNLIQPLLGEDLNCYHCSSVQAQGYSYGLNCAVVTGFEHDQLQFKCVQSCFIIQDRVYLLCCDLETLGFDRHYHAYAVSLLNSFSLLQLDDLIDSHPLGLYKHGTDLFIALHHHVFVAEMVDL